MSNKGTLGHCGIERVESIFKDKISIFYVVWIENLKNRWRHSFVKCVILVIFESLSLLCVLFCLHWNKHSSKLLQELRQEGACCLGLLCASLSYEAEKIFKWIFSKFSSSAKDEVKLLYLCATYKALETVGEKKAFSSVMQVRLRGKIDVFGKKIVLNNFPAMFLEGNLEQVNLE